MTGSRNSSSKKRRGHRKAAAKQLERQQVEEAREERKLAIEQLRAAGCFVFMIPEEWEEESIEQMRAWGTWARRELLAKSPGFLLSPESADAVPESEQRITGFRMACSMVKTV